MNNEFSKELAVAISAAKEAGVLLRDYFQKPYRVIRKSYHEMVAEVDILSQNLIIEKLLKSFPEYAIISEEKSMEKNTKDLTWIIDPLDGTHNYIVGLPFFGISIALADRGNYYLGIIYFPMLDKLYHAIKGKGAFCNDDKIFTSTNNDLSKSMVAYDNQFNDSNLALNNLQLIANESFTVRIFGSATNDLCLIASGRIDARVWISTKIVDIAAGHVIVSEAGGKVTDFNGDTVGIECEQVIATNGTVHDSLISILNK